MADEDTYDLSDQPPPPRPPLRAPPQRRQPEDDPAPAPTPALPAEAWDRDGAEAPTLGYARPGTANTQGRQMVAANARGAAADPYLMLRERRRTFTVPIWLIGAGTLIVFACGWAISGNPLSAAVWLGVGVGWDVIVILLGLVLGSTLVDIETETPGALVLQVTAIVLATAAVFWPITWVNDGALCAALVAWGAATVVYLFLLSYFFDLDSSEVIIVVMVLLVVRLAANFLWLHFFGTFGYLPG